MFCSFNLGGGGRTEAKYITTNANTNENTGASVNVNSRTGNMKGGTKIVKAKTKDISICGTPQAQCVSIYWPRMSENFFDF